MTHIRICGLILFVSGSTKRKNHFPFGIACPDGSGVTSVGTLAIGFTMNPNGVIKRGYVSDVVGKNLEWTMWCI